MRFTTRTLGAYVRGDLYDRETSEETRQFLQALADEARTHGADRALLSIHSSRALFNVQQFSLSTFLELLAARPGHRVALVADTWEVQLAQQYIATLARLKGLAVRAFSSEADAIAWLKA